MSKNINSSDLARQVAEKLKMGKDEELGLYNDLSQIGNGPVKDALDVLTAPNPLNKYVVCFRESCVRDAQYSKTYDAEPLDDEAWLDANDACIYIGIVEAETEIRARQIAAVREGVDTEVIKAILI